MTEKKKIKFIDWYFWAPRAYPIERDPTSPNSPYLPVFPLQISVDNEQRQNTLQLILIDNHNSMVETEHASSFTLTLSFTRCARSCIELSQLLLRVDKVSAFGHVYFRRVFDISSWPLKKWKEFFERKKFSWETHIGTATPAAEGGTGLASDLKQQKIIRE